MKGSAYESYDDRRRGDTFMISVCGTQWMFSKWKSRLRVVPLVRTSGDIYVQRFWTGDARIDKDGKMAIRCAAKIAKQALVKSKRAITLQIETSYGIHQNQPPRLEWPLKCPSWSSLA